MSQQNLREIFPSLSESCCERVLRENNYDMDKAVDECLTLVSNAFNNLRKEISQEREDIVQSIRSNHNDIKQLEVSRVQVNDDDDDFEAKLQKLRQAREIAVRGIEERQQKRDRRNDPQFDKIDKEIEMKKKKADEDRALLHENYKKHQDLIENVKKQFEIIKNQNLLNDSRVDILDPHDFDDDDNELAIIAEDFDDESSESEIDTKLFRVYYDDYSKVKRFKRLLESVANVTSDDISYIDTKYGDNDIHSYIRSHSDDVEDVQLPVVFLRKRYIGDFDKLHELFENNELESLISESESMLDTTPQKLGLFDSALESVERVVNWFNPMAWIGNNDTIAFDEMITFNVIHTNWYCRDLKRRFCFGDNMFMRVHPTKPEIRATYSYDDIELVKVEDSNLVIEYSNDSSPDYIKSSKLDINRMFTLLKNRCVNEPRPKFVDLRNDPVSEE